MSDEEHSADEGPSEAELAMQKRRQAPVSTKGLTEADRELLDTNKQDRERMSEEIAELKRRTEKRKKEREEEEKRMAAERAAEMEKHKAAEEAKRKQKEEEDRKKQQERAKRLAELNKMQESQDSGVTKKSREQLEAEKKAILKQRIQPLNADGLDASGLADKAKELHKLMQRLEGEKYDLEKQFKSQQYDMTELAERARQANKVGKDGLKRVQPGEGETDIIQERFAGTPLKIRMYSKYERQKDLRPYKDRRTHYSGPQYIPPPERIKPTKSIKWNEAGMPQYEEIPGAAE